MTGGALSGEADLGPIAGVPAATVNFEDSRPSNERPVVAAAIHAMVVDGHWPVRARPVGVVTGAGMLITR